MTKTHLALRHLFPLLGAVACGYMLGRQTSGGERQTANFPEKAPSRLLNGALAKSAPALEVLKARFNQAHPSGEDFHTAFQDLVERDPLAVLQHLMAKLPISDEDFGYAAVALQKLAAIDPTRALDFALLLGDQAQRRSALRVVLHAWAEKDPTAAIKVAALHPETRTGDFWQSLAEQWAATDLASASNQGAALPPGPLRTSFLQGLASSWLNQDVDTFTTWFSSLDDRDAFSVAANLTCGGVEKTDLGQIGRLWSALPPGQNRNDIISQLASALVVESPAALTREFARIDQFPDADLKLALRESLFKSMALKDPAATAALLQNLPTDQAETLVGPLAATWANRDSGAALAWAEALKDPHQKAMALSSLIEGSLRNGPDTPFQILSSYPELLGSSQGGEMMEKLMDAGVDPAQMAALTAGVTDAAARHELQATLIQQWSSNDPIGCAQWADSLTQGADRDAAAASLATSLIRKDPQTALAWSLSISDSDQQQQRSTAIFSQWLKTSPESARKWLDQATQLPPSLHSDLAARLK